MDDKSLRRWPHVREWVAGHERQFWISRPVEDSDVSWIDDFGRIHDISKCPVRCRQDDAILRPDLTQRPKEGVTMSGDANIPAGPRESRTTDVPCGHPKNFWSRAFENHHRKVKAGDLESSDRLS